MLLFSTILDINETMTKDSFIRLVIEWNQGSPHADNVIPVIEWDGNRNTRFGDNRLWLGIEEYRNQNTIAIRYEQVEEDGSIWDTDYVLNFNSMKLSIRIDRSYTEGLLETSPQVFTPHLINMLIEGGYLKDDHGLPIKYKATVINNENIELLTDVINGKTNYSLPVVYVSKGRSDENPVNIRYLASMLKGIAHVFVEDGTYLNQAIRRLSNGQNEYYGAIGIYYPSKGVNHTRFLYRSVVGYDDFLFKKVYRAIIKYGNDQRVEPLLTWQGVNNALLRDRLIAQREERIAAEERQRTAEAKLTSFIDTRDEEERRFREKALSDARSVSDKILDSFDEDLNQLEKRVDVLSHDNDVLRAENQGLKAKLDSLESVPVLHMGEEYEFYPGEVKDLILSTLLRVVAAENYNKKTRSRRIDILRDIIAHNDYQGVCAGKAEEVKRVITNYDGMSAKTKQALKDLGFEISDDGKHYKLKYFGDGRYQVTCAKTPSDIRSGKNTASEIIRIAF